MKKPIKKKAGQKGTPKSNTKISRRVWLLGALGLAGVGAGTLWWNTSRSANRSFQEYTYEIVNTYDHDPNAFTQGLVFCDGFLYEGTGQRGESTIRQVELATGNVVRSRPLEDRYFGEGITIWQDRIIQLTWESETGLVFDKQSLEPRGQFRYSGQGWGLTHDGTNLIMSNGSATLRYLQPDTYQEVRTLHVTRFGFSLDRLNELEYFGGEIYANVWGQDFIARISPETGEVVGELNLTGLRPDSTWADNDAVLNGIAYDARGERLFVTGKRWPKLFEIRQIST